MNIIMYHFARPPKVQNEFEFTGLSLDEFSEQIKNLRKNFKFLSYEEIIERINNQAPFSSKEELPEIRFVTIGVGMQPTKLHEATLKAASRAGEHYTKTQSWLTENTHHGLHIATTRLCKLFDFALSSSKKVITGRNWSLYWDDWENFESGQKLADNSLKLIKTKFSYDSISKLTPPHGNKLHK